jgi:hypothetical protein
MPATCFYNLGTLSDKRNKNIKNMITCELCSEAGDAAVLFRRLDGTAIVSAVVVGLVTNILMYCGNVVNNLFANKLKFNEVWLNPKTMLSLMD